WLIGQLAHASYQFDYLNAFIEKDVLAEFMISLGGKNRRAPSTRGQLVDYRTLRKDPRALAAQFAFGKYRPDLIDLTDGDIYEFKPLRGAALGVLQLWRYMHNFNLATLFNELVAEKNGTRQDTSRYALAGGRMPGEILIPVELTQFVDAYLKRKRGAAKKY